ncbi:MAG TPA: ammonia channel protein, partial [Nitrospiraceae bacterium]|nr:ammonia channel protein [Nitrospiraceae bacterium]
MERFLKLILAVCTILILSSAWVMAEEPSAPPGGASIEQGAEQAAPALAEAAPAEAAAAPGWDAKIAADTVWVLI